MKKLIPTLKVLDGERFDQAYLHRKKKRAILEWKREKGQKIREEKAKKATGESPTGSPTKEAAEPKMIPKRKRKEREEDSTPPKTESLSAPTPKKRKVEPTPASLAETPTQPKEKKEKKEKQAEQPPVRQEIPAKQSEQPLVQPPSQKIVTKAPKKEPPTNQPSAQVAPKPLNPKKEKQPSEAPLTSENRGKKPNGTYHPKEIKADVPSRLRDIPETDATKARSGVVTILDGKAKG